MNTNVYFIRVNNLTMRKNINPYTGLEWNQLFSFCFLFAKFSFFEILLITIFAYICKYQPIQSFDSSLSLQLFVYIYNNSCPCTKVGRGNDLVSKGMGCMSILCWSWAAVFSKPLWPEWKSKRNAYFISVNNLTEK